MSSRSARVWVRLWDEEKIYSSSCDVRLLIRWVMLFCWPVRSSTFLLSGEMSLGGGVGARSLGG